MKMMIEWKCNSNNNDFILLTPMESSLGFPHHDHSTAKERGSENLKSRGPASRHHQRVAPGGSLSTVVHTRGGQRPEGKLPGEAECR